MKPPKIKLRSSFTAQSQEQLRQRVTKKIEKLINTKSKKASWFQTNYIRREVRPVPKVGIYCRLSIEDKDKAGGDDSASIQNQKAMLRDYCIERGWEIYDIYIDA